MAKRRAVAVRRRRSNGGGSGGISVSVIAGLIPGLAWSLAPAQSGNWPHAGERIIAAYTGFYIPERRFRLDLLMYGLMPLLIGSVIHGIAQRTGVNRAIKKFLPLPIQV